MLRQACQMLPGSIREVAENMCGGSQPLENALKRGAAVSTVTDQGVEMIFFPTTKIGNREAVKEAQTVSRSKETSTHANDTMRDLFDKLNWGINVTQRQLEACSCPLSTMHCCH